MALDWVRDIQDIYTQGLESARSVAGDETAPIDATLRTDVEKIINLGRENVTWCYTDSQGNLFALEDGVVQDALIIVMHPAVAATKVATISTEAGLDPPHMFIAPERMAIKWAGASFVHELGHIYDLVQELEPASPSVDEWMAGEARAYRREIALVNAITSGALDASLADNTDSYSALQESYTQQTLLKNAAGLAESLDIGVSQSQAERGQRLAFCAVAILFHIRDALVDNADASGDKTDLQRVRDLT
jgi:hypothetical protein